MAADRKGGETPTTTKRTIHKHDERNHDAARKETPAASKPPTDKGMHKQQPCDRFDLDGTDDEPEDELDTYVRAIVATAPAPDAELAERIAGLLGFGCH